MDQISPTGVLWSLTGKLPGVKEGIDAINKLKKSLGFVTNNSVTKRVKYESKFATIGVSFDYQSQLIHPAASFVAYLDKINFDKRKTIFLIGTSVHKLYLEEHGYKYKVAVSDHSR